MSALCEVGADLYARTSVTFGEHSIGLALQVEAVPGSSMHRPRTPPGNVSRALGSSQQSGVPRREWAWYWASTRDLVYDSHLLCFNARHRRSSARRAPRRCIWRRRRARATRPRR